MFSDHLLASTQKKNMMKRTQACKFEFEICKLEIRIEETWTLLKAKIAIATALNGENELALLLTGSKIS